MRRYRKQVLIIAAVAAIGFIFYYIYPLYKGIKPALLPPPEDITEIENAEENLGLQLPDGFRISIFAKGLGKPRVMEHDPLGNLLVSIPSRGKVVALPDENHDGVADKVVTVIEGLNRPHGLATRCGRESCEFYIAESDQVAAYAYNQKNLKATHKRKIVDLPGGGNHFTRTILFLPQPQDGRMLISVGSSCNVCDEKDWRRAKVLSVYADGSDFGVFSSGLRNAVFMTIHPKTGEIWATEMGRDWLGDELPPDEINVLSREGEDFGWPICYGDGIYDEKFNGLGSVEEGVRACVNAKPPFIQIPAHSSPLGLVFMDNSWSEEYEGDLFVAYHGSWNRSIPTGYKIVRFKQIAGNTSKAGEDFITGWLTEDGTSVGRPVDIKIGPDGAMYISDDKAGVIYRVTKE